MRLCLVVVVVVLSALYEAAAQDSCAAAPQVLHFVTLLDEAVANCTLESLTRSALHWQGNRFELVVWTRDQPDGRLAQLVAEQAPQQVRVRWLPLPQQVFERDGPLHRLLTEQQLAALRRGDGARLDAELGADWRQSLSNVLRLWLVAQLGGAYLDSDQTAVQQAPLADHCHDQLPLFARRSPLLRALLTAVGETWRNQPISFHRALRRYQQLHQSDSACQPACWHDASPLKSWTAIVTDTTSTAIDADTTSDRVWRLSAWQRLLSLARQTESPRSALAITLQGRQMLASCPTSVDALRAEPAQLRQRAADAAMRQLNKLTDGTQQSSLEYAMVVSAMTSVQRPRVLVFGTGRDTPVYQQLIDELGGQLAFLEDNQEWVDYAHRTASPQRPLHVYKVDYSTMISRDRDDILTLPREQWHRALWLRSIPAQVLDVAWDVILVDAPRGDRSNMPGRFQSVYSALAIAQMRDHGRSTKVLLHDCNRPIEDQLGRRMLNATFEEVASHWFSKKMRLFVVHGQNKALDSHANLVDFPQHHFA